MSRGNRQGRPFTSRRVPASEAWDYPEIEFRTPNSQPCIVLDVDGSNALERVLWSVEKGRVLGPNWMVTRKDGGGTHMVYTLARPVLTGPDMRAAPIRLLGRVSEYYASAVEADSGYTGVLSHNPMARAHGPGFATNWGSVANPTGCPSWPRLSPSVGASPKHPGRARGETAPYSMRCVGSRVHPRMPSMTCSRSLWRSIKDSSVRYQSKRFEGLPSQSPSGGRGGLRVERTTRPNNGPSGDVSAGLDRARRGASARQTGTRRSLRPVDGRAIYARRGARVWAD